MTLQSILDERNVAYRLYGQHHHTTQGRIQVDCPFCSAGSNRFRMGIDPARGVATCWTCGYHRMGDTLSELIGESLPAALNLLGTLPRLRERRLTGGKPRGRLLIPSGVEPLRRPHRAYLRERGFDPDELTRLWGVKGIGVAARLAWRLWIPIHRRGRIVSWTTRAIGNGKRYISAAPSEEEVSHKTLLFGQDFVRHAVVVCEGPTDVWRIGPGAVATLGLTYSMAQVLQLSVFPIRVVCFDRERAAQKRAKKLAGELQIYPGETHVVELESGEDAAGASGEEIGELRKEFLE